MYVSAIIAAGGRGQRLGDPRPKQLLTIGGRPILERTVSLFLTHPAIDEVIVALPAELVAEPPEYLRSATKALCVVAGGARRQDSVARAFQRVAERADVVVVHDAARPFASADLISRTIAAATESGAAVAALQARDTVKLGELSRSFADQARLDATPGDGLKEERWVVTATLPRASIHLAQTPQAFRRDVLGSALGDLGDATDEAALVERAGHLVRLVDGEATNIKITTPDDLRMAEAMAMPLRPAVSGRAGIGYDIHRLVTGRPLVLGGVTIPFDRGLAGHSDADAVCHAVTDAILGAASAGDIGRHFPDTDPRWAGASSIDLLRRAVEIIGELGLTVGNVDATIIAERPKLVTYIDSIRASLARALGVPVDRVSVKGKTNEGLGELGRGEAVAVHAIALVRSI